MITIPKTNLLSISRVRSISEDSEMAAYMVDQVEEQSTCMICLQTPKAPKSIPCGHAFCTSCLKDAVRLYHYHNQGTSDREISCPVCGKLTALPTGGVDGFGFSSQTSSVLKNIQGTSVQDGGKPCEICEAKGWVNVSKAMCLTCNMKLCPECTDKHLRKQLFSNHKIKSLVSDNPNDVVCRTHTDKTVTYFCKTCNKPLCPICVENSHEHHSLGDLKSSLEGQRMTLQAVLEPVKPKLTQAREGNDCLVVLVNAREQAFQDAKQVLQNRAKQMVSNVQQQESAILGKLDNQSPSQLELMLNQEAKRAVQVKTREILVNLQDQETKLLTELEHKLNETREENSSIKYCANFQVENLRSVCSFTANILRGLNPLLQLQVYDDLLARLTRVSESKPIKFDNIKEAIKFVPTRSELSLGNLQAYNLPEVEASGTMMRRHATLERHTTLETPDQRRYSMRSSPSSTLERPVPMKRSPSERSGSLRGVPPKLPLDIPKLVLRINRKGCYKGQLRLPTCGAFLPNGNFVIADGENDRLQVHDKDGNPLQVIGAQVIKPFGVVVTPEGNLAVTDQKDKCVKIFRLDGILIAHWGKFAMPAGIAITSKGEYIVSDTGQQSIMVHDQKGRLLTQFGARGSKDQQFHLPFYVAVTNYDQIVVSDKLNHCIKMFSMGGRFIHKFGQKGDADGHLKYPNGVCVNSNNNIVVVDGENRRVCLFSPNGTFIRSILTDKDVMDPRSVATSQTGQLLITDAAPRVCLYQIYAPPVNRGFRI